MDLYLEAENRPGSWVSKRLWEQEGLDMVWIWEAEQVTEAYRDLGERVG